MCKISKEYGINEIILNHNSYNNNRSILYLYKLNDKTFQCTIHFQELFKCAVQ